MRIRIKHAALIVLLAIAPMAWALSLQEAKQQGLVGEGRDGYVGLVEASAGAEVQALVREVNAQRRERYQRIARENDISISQVTALAYEKAVQETSPGNYVQLPNGEWVRK